MASFFGSLWLYQDYIVCSICLVEQFYLCLTGDALSALKGRVMDPGNELQSWDSTLPNPCTWFHITCNGDSRVTRV